MANYYVEILEIEDDNCVITPCENIEDVQLAVMRSVEGDLVAVFDEDYNEIAKYSVLEAPLYIEEGELIGTANPYEFI